MQLHQPKAEYFPLLYFHQAFKGTSTLVKMFTVSFQSILGTRPLCLSSLWDGDSWRKKRTATGITIPKKYNGNMSYKDSRAIMTSLIYPKTLHTFKYKAKIKYSEGWWFSSWQLILRQRAALPWRTGDTKHKLNKGLRPSYPVQCLDTRATFLC